MRKIPLARTLLLAGLWGGMALGGCGGSASLGGAAYVLDPTLVHYGASYSGWSARWWQWAYELPRPDHPLFDASGAEAARGQVDPVWFLCGTFTDGLSPNTGVAVRDISIPSGIALFFPIINTEWDNVNCLPPGWISHSVTELRADSYAAVSAVEDVYCVIDGDAVLNSPDLAGAIQFRATSPVFSAFLPDNNIVASICPGDPYAAHVVDPIVSDGIWMMLAPMPVGTHTIHFGGTFPLGGPFVEDITYNITVLP